MKTIKWVSNDQYDIMKDMFGLPNYLVEAPLYIDDDGNDIYIQNYIRTPLYNGMVLNEVYGKVENFQPYIDDIPIKRLTFYTDKTLTIDEVNGIISILTTVFCKNYHYPINNIIHQYDQGHYFIPTVAYDPLYNAPYIFPPLNPDISYTAPYTASYNTANNVNIYDVYDTIENIEKIHNNVIVDNMVGYTTLLNNRYEDIDQDILCSDFIWMCNLDKYNYINMYDIPVVKVEEIIQFKSALVERGIHDIDTFVDTIRNLMRHSFLIDVSYKDIIEEFINIYHFTLVGYSLNNHICLQHPFLDKQWLLNAIYNIYNNKLPMLSIADKWVFLYESNLTTQISLKYATMRALYETNNPVLQKHVNDIVVDSGLIITVPFLSDNTTDIIIKINLYMKQSISIYEAKDEHDAKAHGVALSLYNKWYAIIDGKPMRNDVISLNIPGTVENNRVYVDGKMYYLDQNTKITDRQLQYLWSSGKFLNDWAYNYYITNNKISVIPLLHTDDILYYLEANV